jgi:soluble lytic murein transglycosylase
MKTLKRARLAPIYFLACAAWLAPGLDAWAKPKDAKTGAKQAPAAKGAAKGAAKKPKEGKKSAPKTAQKPAAKASKPGPSATKPASKAKTGTTKAHAAQKSNPKQAPKPVVARAPEKTLPPPPRPRPGLSTNGGAAPVAAAGQAQEPASNPLSGAGRFFASAVPTFVSPAVSAPAEVETASQRAHAPLSYAPAAPPSEADIDLVREGLALARSGKTEAATDRRDRIRDTAGKKLVEWMILRSEDGAGGFSRYAAFVRANPAWPSAGMLRRRAEARLWQEKLDASTVRGFFAEQPPLGPLGKLTLARALTAQGDRGGAQRLVRDAWRNDDFSAALEAQVLEDFGGLLTRADHKARMDERLYDDDFDTAMRAAKRLGAAEIAIVQARVAVERKARNAGALLEAVPPGARADPAYVFTRAQWLRRNDRIGEAAQLMLSAPRDPEVIRNADQWWIERRILARKLLDADNPQAAYKVARDAAPPAKENHHVDQQFTAGWIALRFLKDPNTAMPHFARINAFAKHPTSRARAGYWLGRAAETLGRGGEARQHYANAAQYTAAYYGQLARARLGHRDIAVRPLPALSGSQRASLRNVDLVRAVELLYATGNRDLIVTFVADLERVGDVGALTMIAEVCARHADARAMLYLGKDALARGHAFEQFAYPGVGIPNFSALEGSAEKSLVYAIARQESAFNPKAVSSARAMGLMQVTPGTGRLIAKKHGVAFNEKKLLHDPVFNAQMGAAEIGSLVRDYDGNHVLAFAGYNAGRGRVKEWVARYGDPRSPDVDVVDWVERIPFTETRNYVQRVMENMQIYRARFGGGARLAIDADMRGARQQ